MIEFSSLRNDLIERKITVEDLYDYKDDFLNYSLRIMNNRKFKVSELEDFIILCLDYYALSKTGQVLIPDRNYDECMRSYMSYGNNDMIIFPDNILDITQWDFVDHEEPGLVGSISKIYEYDELKDFFNKNKGITRYILAPKYDGISCGMKVEDGIIELALTRYDGIKGQDITELIRRARISFDPEIGKSFVTDKGLLDGYYKCEIVVSTDDYNQLIQHKNYANRRSATSGIIGTPKNVSYGRYLTLIPLLYYKNDRIKYIPLHAKIGEYYHPRDMMDDIEKMMTKYKDHNFQYRVDGIVIYPIIKGMPVNKYDFMDEAIAYKINTNEAITTIEYGYMSVGRLGNAIPMLKVKPCEVNETVVTDISLGSYDKFLSMNLYEGEEIIAYSAGDVIPQAKVIPSRNEMYRRDELKIPKICPYCGQKLTRYGTEYKCKNPDCIRVNTGRIANFLDQMGIVDFSDTSIETLYKAGIIHDIKSLFFIEPGSIAKLEGFSNKSESKILSQLESIKNKPISSSKLFGALGITLIKEKKCRKIFEVIPLNKLMSMSNKKIVKKAVQADGIGTNTAIVFADFVDENRDLIEFLLNNMNIVDDASYKGAVVFTGFRNPEWEAKFRSIGIDVGQSVTSNTLAVVAAGSTTSTKCKAAIRKGVSIIDVHDIENLYNQLSKL